MSADLSKVQSFQYPAGHLGNLTASQATALAEFKKLCEEKGYWHRRVESKDAASHDDETLLRFLRARRFNPQQAFEQFKDTEDWRAENQLPELYETIDAGEYDETRRLYPQWTGRLDRRGIPVYVFEVAPLNSKAVSAYEQSTSSKNPSVTNTRKAPVKMLRLFALYENLTSFVMPWCTATQSRPHPGTPISQSNNIVDISKVGLKQFWNLKNHMQDASTLATAHYPETLDRIFIIGAPSFFPTVWSWIRRWFDPITVSKIFILSRDQVFPTLSEFIEPANIPKKYGGELEYHFGDMPIIEPALAEGLTWGPGAGSVRDTPTVPMGPVRWEEDADGHMVAWAVGTENGQPRRKVVATLKRRYRDVMFPGADAQEDEDEEDWADAEEENGEAQNAGDDAAATTDETKPADEVTPATKPATDDPAATEPAKANGAVPNGTADPEKQSKEVSEKEMETTTAAMKDATVSS